MGGSELAMRTREFISNLVVTQGQGIGHPFEVLDWQKQFLDGALADGVTEAALSIARGNGKSTFAAAIAAAAIADGPLAVPRGDVVCVAGSGQQATIVAEHVERFLSTRPDWEEKGAWIVRRSPRYIIEHKPTQTRLTMIANNSRTSLGLAPRLIICDEPEAWGKSQLDDGRLMYASLQTSLGKIPGSKLIALGTRSADPDHWWEELQKSADFSMVFSATERSPIHSRRSWLKANPSLEFMPNLEAAIRSESKRVKKDSSSEPQFRAYRLNQPVSASTESLLIASKTWRGCEGDADEEGPAYWGVDLGHTLAMSAVSCYWPKTGRLRALAAYPAEPSLKERAARDNAGNMYQKMHEAGDLLTLGQRTVPVAELLAAAFQRFGRPQGIASDRWKQAELLDALEQARLPLTELELRGQGFKDGGEDVRTFQRACLDGKVNSQASMLLRSSMESSRVQLDPAGNQKLTRASRKRANDAAVSTVLAVALGVRKAPKASKKRRRRMAVAR